MRCSALVAAGVLAMAAALPAAAQDPVTSNADVYHVVLDTPTVRVLRVTLKPEGRTTMHEYPDNIVIALSNARVKFTGSDGQVVDATLQADRAVWSPAGTHSGENLEKTPAEVLLVELKGSGPAKATVSTTRARMRLDPFFDNPRAMAYKATADPSFHEPAGSTHDFDQVVIALGDSNDMSVDVDGKVTSQWKRGDVLFIGRGVKHESRNTGGKPLDVIIAAIK